MFLSGDDYPLKPLREMDKFILQNYDTIFMNVKYAYEKWPSFNERVSKYKINKSSKKEDFLLLKGFNKQTLESLLKGHITILQFLKISFIQRRLKTRSKFYGRSNWWQMNIPNH